MWEGIKGNRLQNGAKGLLFGIIVTSFLLYLSFYLYYIYILIPIILVVIFHYSGSWRVSDRAFYGFIAIFIAFLISVAAISFNLEGTPHNSITTIKNSLGTYSVYFNYTKEGNLIEMFIKLNTTEVYNATARLYDLINARNIEIVNLVFNKVGENSTTSLSLNNLSGSIYIIFLNLTFHSSNSTVSTKLGLLGPILVSPVGLWLYLVKDLAISYLLVTYGFFIIFVALIRFMNKSRERNMGKMEEPQNKGKEDSQNQKEDNNKNQ